MNANLSERVNVNGRPRLADANLCQGLDAAVRALQNQGTDTLLALIDEGNEVGGWPRSHRPSKHNDPVRGDSQLLRYKIECGPRVTVDTPLARVPWDGPVAGVFDPNDVDVEKVPAYKGCESLGSRLSRMTKCQTPHTTCPAQQKIAHHTRS
jgi:hypothetical protein